MVLSDRSISALCDVTDNDIKRAYGALEAHALIEPFIDHQVRTDTQGNPITSYGLSYAGYDIRLESCFRIFNKPNDGRVIDIKAKSHDDYDEKVSEQITSDDITLPPGGLVISHSMETFNIPHQIVGICTGKSTLARSGLLVNVTPLEPGWRGKLVVELTNGTNLPLKIYSQEGICQIQFHLMDTEPTSGYAGKYQDQIGIVGSRL